MQKQDEFSYLKPKQYYINLYDLRTINDCLYYYQSLYKKLPEARELKTEASKEKNETDWLRMINMVIHSIKTDRFKHKEETISEWMEKDRIRQEKYDNACPLELYCEDCKVLLSSGLKTMHEDKDGDLKVSHIYTCPKCKNRSAYYDNGDEFVVDPELCVKCGATIDVSIKINKKKDTTTWIHKCSGCGEETKHIDDHKEWEANRQKQKKQDEELLTKFRNDFCFNESDGNEAVLWFERIERINEGIKQQTQKEEDPAYQKAKKVHKLKVTELHKRLSDVLTKDNYIDLIFEKPEMDRYVVVPFVVSDSKEGRAEYDSKRQLKKLITNKLSNTNWRLMSDGINYRVGYLTGRLRCYENEDDLVEIMKN